MIFTIDTGGTKTLVASFDSSGKLTHSFKFQTPRDINEYFNLVKSTIETNFDAQSAEGVVVAMPGITEGESLIWAKNLGWHNVNIVDLFRTIFPPNTPIFLENDANLAGLSEARFSGQSGTVLYLTLSTGIGSGVVYNLNIAPTLRKSEAGKIKINLDGTLREWEDFASGSALVASQGGNLASNINDNDVWKDYAHKVSLGLLSIIPILQPNLIVFGGGVGSQFSKFEGFLKTELSHNLPNHINTPELKVAQNPHEAVIYGCFEYAKDRLI